MNFGVRTQALFSDPRWTRRDELEALLEFAAKYRQLDRYTSRLVKKPRERNATLAELTVAYDLAA
ncbi:MAG: hypothetical protein ACXW5U_09390 [Thermoanaerobaculia bacterium]